MSSAHAAPPEPATRVLIVEDDPAQARLVEVLVSAAGLASVGTATGTVAAVELAPQADVILADYQLDGDSTGLDVLREVRARRLPASVVVMKRGTATITPEELTAVRDKHPRPAVVETEP